MKLLSPIKVGGLELRNRIVMSAMHLGFAEEGFVTERLIRFYEERAKGGAGLIVVGGCDIDEHAYPTMVSINDDKYIPGLRDLTERIKAQGARICCQLFQPGRYSFSVLSGVKPVAPSPVYSALTRETPRELTIQEIHGIIDKFGQAAARAKAAGFDMVEIIGSAGYLIGQFLSPKTNLRQDEFGGSLENRMRFGLEVVRQVRKAVGKDIPISFRFPGNELVPGGTSSEELLEFARQLEKAGVDLFNVTGGWHESIVPQLTMDVPEGVFVYLATAVKQAVRVPVVASNRINDPMLAEKILKEGRADLVTMARGLMADPYLPQKVQEGRLNEIRKCIACNQACMDHVFSMQPIECMINPEAGHEFELTIKPALKKKKILVVGGGPGGMEAARIASIRGHEVHLWEKQNRLGGQLNLASIPPGRAEFRHLIDYLVTALNKQGVKIELNKRADVDEIKALGFDVVIVATGAEPLKPDIPGADKPHVTDAWTLLEQAPEIGKDVVVVGGGAVGCETALHLARMGTIDPEVLHFLFVHKVEDPERLYSLATKGIKNVTLVEQDAKIGRDIGRSTKWVIAVDLPRYGVKVLTSTKVISIGDDHVLVEREGQEMKMSCDNVVLAIGSKPVNDLVYRLNGVVQEIYVIGDAKKPRKVMDAMHEGFRLGLVI